MSEHVVLEIPFESMGALRDRFDNIFGEEHDSLWPHIPEIRRQVEALEADSEDEMPPPGFITLPPDVMGSLGLVLEATNSGVNHPVIAALAGDMRDAELNGPRMDDPHRVNVVGDVLALIAPRPGILSSVLLTDWLVTPGDHALRYEHSRIEGENWLRILVNTDEYEAMTAGVSAGDHLSIECTIMEGMRVLRALSVSRFPLPETNAC